MAAKVFQILGCVFVVLFLFLFMIILPLINKLLKNVNKSFSARTRDVKQEMADSMSEIETAQREIAGMMQFTDQLRSILNSSINAADLAIDFLNSKFFKIGFTGSIWFLFATIALPRGLHRKRVVKPKREIIPPPSWEKA